MNLYTRCDILKIFNRYYVTMFSPTVQLIFQTSCGICWLVAYVLIIYKGFVDKCLGMPLIALCTNISWEFIFSFIHPYPPPLIYINYLWLLFDCIIFLQAIKFGSCEFTSLWVFLSYFVLSLVLSFCAVLFITWEFKDFDGVYAGFGDCLMMSAMFISMFIHRDSLAGQSIYIASSKLIGTLFASIVSFDAGPFSYLFTYLYISIFVLDSIYLGMVWKATHNRQGYLPLDPGFASMI